MLIINEQHRAREMAQQWKALTDLPYKGVNCQYLHEDPQLLITSSLSVLRLPSDYSKDEAHMIYMHTGKTLILFGKIQQVGKMSHTCNPMTLKPWVVLMS